MHVRLCLIFIDYCFLIMSSKKDFFHVQCHVWLIGGSMERGC